MNYEPPCSMKYAKSKGHDKIFYSIFCGRNCLIAIFFKIIVLNLIVSEGLLK